MSILTRNKKTQPKLFEEWGNHPKIFDTFFRGMFDNPSFITTNMDLEETDKDYRLSLELAGLKEKDVEISLDDNILTIKGEKKFEDRKETKRFHVYERSYGSFERSISLPKNIDDSKISASLKDGVLEVNIPKKTGSAQEHKKISIKPT